MGDTRKTSIHDGLEVQTRSRHWRERPHGGRVYVPWDLGSEPEPSGPLCTDLNCKSPWCKSARDRGKPEFCEVDHKLHRAWFNRTLKEVKARIAPALADHFKVPEDSIKLSFSRTAGCSCGCSPGFRLKGGWWDVDTWIRETQMLAPGSILAANIASVAREASQLTRV